MCLVFLCVPLCLSASFSSFFAFKVLRLSPSLSLSSFLSLPASVCLYFYLLFCMSCLLFCPSVLSLSFHSSLSFSLSHHLHKMSHVTHHPRPSQSTAHHNNKPISPSPYTRESLTHSLTPTHSNQPENHGNHFNKIPQKFSPYTYCDLSQKQS